MGNVLGFLLIVMSLLLPEPTIAGTGTSYELNRWASKGETHWRHDSGGADYGVPSSELDYRDVDSDITEFIVRTPLSGSLAIRATFGLGSIGSGTLVDDDYLSASGASKYGATQSGEHRFSRTYSEIEGDGLFYIKGELVPMNLVLDSSFGRFRFNLSAQYWQEEYHATGLETVECTASSLCSPVGSSGYQGISVISNTVTWTGVGITMEGVTALSNRWTLLIDATYYPLMDLVNDDIHHQRSDLAKNPSARMTGKGNGYDLMAVLRVQLTHQLSAHLGYRRWERWVENQTLTSYLSDGSSSTARLMDLSTHRDGLVAGLAWLF